MTFKYRDEKNKRWDRLSRSDQEDLLGDLIQAFVLVKDPQQAAAFVADLLTRNEVRDLSKRLAIAKLLLENQSYEQICQRLKTSHGTIGKVSSWLAEGGEGFRTVIAGLPKKKEVKHWSDYDEWDKLKRRYPSYYWPELLLEGIVRSANKQEKEKLRRVLNKLDRKDSLDKKLKELLAEDYRRRPRPD